MSAEISSEKVRIPQIYSIEGLYSSLDMFSPPSERRSHVIRFELTTGCQWSRCTYCCGFDGIPFRIKSITDFKAHVDSIFEKLSEESIRNLKRLFIGGGDALALDCEVLLWAVKYARDTFIAYTGRRPTRIAIYGGTRSLIKKTENELAMLRQYTSSGDELLVYWGVESGSTDVLSYVQKGYTRDDIFRAAEKMRVSGMSASIMIMPGLGGKKYEEDHMNETATILGYISPQFLTFMGINPRPESLYARRMKGDFARGINKPLSDNELAHQIIGMIDGALFTKPLRIGCYEQYIDGVGRNPFTFRADLLDSQNTKELAETLRQSLASVIWQKYWDFQYSIREILEDRNVKLHNVSLSELFPGKICALVLSERSYDETTEQKKAIIVARKQDTKITIMTTQEFLPNIESFVQSGGWDIDIEVLEQEIAI